MLTFVLFGGFGSSKQYWEYESNNEDVIKHNFITKLNELGNVYCVSYNWFNIYKYDSRSRRRNLSKSNIKKYNWWSKDILFNLKDLDYDVLCKKVLNEVDNLYPNSELIVIGHSYGGLIALTFSKLYKKRCKGVLILDGSPIMSKEDQIDIFNSNEKKNEKMINDELNNDKKLHKMILKIKKESNVDELIDKINSLVWYKRRLYNIEHIDGVLNTYTVFISNLSSEYNGRNIERDKEKKLIESKNKVNMYKFVYTLNVSHILWYDEMTKNVILDELKLMLNKCNFQNGGEYKINYNLKYFIQ
jgi:hypothetical protein